MENTVGEGKRLSAILLFACVFQYCPFVGVQAELVRSAATHPEERILKKTVVATTSVEKAWEAWTTSEGVTKFGPPRAHIELRTGGPFEWYFAPDAPSGQRGSEGCRVLSYLPERMLSFEWNAPPSIASLRESGARTHVVVQFEQLDEGRTRVTLSQLGFGSGEEWDKYYNYFDSAWGTVLDRFVAATAGSIESDSSKGNTKREPYWVYFIYPAREDFLTSATQEEEAKVREHVAYLKDMRDRGVVVFAGRSIDPTYFPDESRGMKRFEMDSPGIVIYHAANADAARLVMEKDPAVAGGVFKAKCATFGPFIPPSP